MTLPVLSVAGLRAGYGEQDILHDVSLDVPAGAFVSVIGPNGAGKSTLFKMIASFVPTTSGEVIFKGERISNLAPHLVARKGVVRTFQETTIFRSMSVRENVMVGGHARTRSGYVANALRTPAVRREEARLGGAVDRLLALLDLEAVAEVAVMDLSFGTQKRVELGRALASEPKLLLLDEPAGGLNHEEVETLMDLLRRIRAELGLTVIEAATV